MGTMFLQSCMFHITKMKLMNYFLLSWITYNFFCHVSQCQLIMMLCYQCFKWKNCRKIQFRIVWNVISVGIHIINFSIKNWNVIMNFLDKLNSCIIKGRHVIINTIMLIQILSVISLWCITLWIWIEISFLWKFSWFSCRGPFNLHFYFLVHLFLIQIRVLFIFFIRMIFERIWIKLLSYYIISLFYIPFDSFGVLGYFRNTGLSSGLDKAFILSDDVIRSI